MKQIELPAAASLIKCWGVYDVEASVVVVTRDSHVLLSRSNTQPKMEPKTLFMLPEIIVAVVAFNGSSVTLATANPRSIKCFTLQVDQTINKCSSLSL